MNRLKIKDAMLFHPSYAAEVIQQMLSDFQVPKEAMLPGLFQLNHRTPFGGSVIQLAAKPDSIEVNAITPFQTVGRKLPCQLIELALSRNARLRECAWSLFRFNSNQLLVLLGRTPKWCRPSQLRELIVAMIREINESEPRFQACM